MHCTFPSLLFRWRPGWLACLVLAAAGPGAGAAVFFTEAGRPTAAAQQAVAVLAGAAAEGLLAQDYQAAPLARAVQRAAQDAPLDTDAAAQLDNALTFALHRYLGDLHAGRIDPRTVQADFSATPMVRTEPAVLLAAALAGPQPLADGLRAAAPQVPLYARLRSALAQYRVLVGHPAWDTPLPPLPVPAQRALQPGQAWAGLALLAQRLEALGDLPPGAQAPATDDTALQDAVKAFQRRHGLDDDGLPGQATLAQLAVPPAQRAEQIVLAMERLRWTPLLQAPRTIVVNVPEFVLYAHAWQDGVLSVPVRMNVIVGKAPQQRTPVFSKDLRFIEFSPYWNIPPSIARSETVPRLRQDPAYFAQQGLEFVDAKGGVTTALSGENLDAVLRGQLRLRQRPGPRNALGDIKFVLPNSSNIFLHHTPAPQLFERARRDLSHGCIRVEEPVALAQFVLQDDPAWTAERIRAAMQRGQSSTLRLDSALPVVIAYSTTIVKNDKVHFFADLYGHDRLLEQALRQHARARQAARAAAPF